MPGTEDLLREEIRRRASAKVQFLPSRRADEHHFLCDMKPARLQALRLCHALHVRKDFPVIRPRGLLSPEHLKALVLLMRACMAMSSGQKFTGFRFDAAGADSPTFQRLGEALAKELGLPHDAESGECLLTVRPADNGWEVLCRVGARPLSTRLWRVANYHGSLNANLAAAMVELSAPSPADRFLNTMCGSGTLLIERLKRARVACAWGVDDSGFALETATNNRRKAAVQDGVGLLRADARQLPFAEDSFDVVCADLPWGESHGKRSSNPQLYQQSFAEAGRVCRTGGKFVALTQDRESLAAVDDEISRYWDLSAERTFVQRGFRPTCLVYVRR